MTIVDWAWLAGIVDSEGSIDLAYKRCKRGAYHTTVRIARMRVRTCDHIVAPRIASWFAVNAGVSAAKNTLHSDSNGVTIAGRRLRQLLPSLIPHLFTKQPHAQRALAALNIKAGVVAAYSVGESTEWHRLYEEVRVLNLGGKKSRADEYERYHAFSWPWFAGFVDGDGTIMVGKFGPHNRSVRKPILKVSLAHHPTISYLAKQLDRGELASGRASGNKRATRSVRLMSGDLLRVLPEIIPFLVIKKRQAELALEIVGLRAVVPNGQYNHPNIAIARQLLAELDELNTTSKKSRRQA